MIAALVMAATQPQAAFAFAPPLDKPYRVVLHQERIQRGVTRRYETERRLVFHRDGGGIVAELVLVRVWSDSTGAAGRRFEAAAGALIGRAVRLHLAPDGSVTAIDDEAALWAATLAGITAAASPDRDTRAAAALAHDPAAAFAALSPERRRAMLAMPFTSLLVGHDEPLTPGSGPITLPSGVIPGQTLAGTRRVAIWANAMRQIIVHAAAEDISFDRDRTVDPATGLVVEEQQTQTIGTGAAAQIMRQHVSLSPMVS